METGASQNVGHVGRNKYVGRNENVTFLATCLNHKFFSFDSKVIEGIIVIND